MRLEHFSPLYSTKSRILANCPRNEEKISIATTSGGGSACGLRQCRVIRLPVLRGPPESLGILHKWSLGNLARDSAERTAVLGGIYGGICHKRTVRS